LIERLLTRAFQYFGYPDCGCGARRARLKKLWVIVKNEIRWRLTPPK
jgi:hypothetical protein